MRVEDAIYHTVHRGVGLEVLATRMGMSANTMQHKANPNADNAYFRPRELMEIMDFQRDYTILHAMAAETGGQYVPPRDFTHLGDEALLDLFLETQKRAGTFADDFQKAWADGNLSEKEFERLKTDAYQVHQIYAEMLARMETLRERRATPVLADVARFVHGNGGR